MSSQLKLRRGGNASHATFTGAVGEATYNTDTGGLHAHDGTTPGGLPLSTVVDIADYTALRAYTGRATAVRITTPGIAGFFQRDADTTTADNGGTVIVDGAGRRWKRVFDNEIIPQWFDAKGDGLADDTIALRKWLNAEGGIHLLGDESKTYIVAPTVAGEVILPLLSGSKRQIFGNGAAIKIKAGSAGFYAILGSNSTVTNLGDAVISGIVFDYNRSGNTYAVSGGLLVHPRMTFAALNGSNIRFVGNTIKDAVCTNSVYLNGNDGAGNALVIDPVVEGNKWFSVGGGAASAYDHSTIYTNGVREVIRHNEGVAQSVNAFGTACFVETHGTSTRVHDNYCLNFRGFGNITGIRAAGDSEQLAVYDNVAEVIQFGVRLFSAANPPHTTGYGINNAHVHGNNIRIKQTLLAGGASNYYIGVGIQPGSTLPVKDVFIHDNVVIYDEELATSSYTSLAASVGVSETSGTPLYENIQIKNNTVVNAPAAAIGLGFGGGVFKNCVVNDNTLINPGQGLNAATAAYKTGVLLAGNSYIGSLEAERNKVVDEFDSTRLEFGIYAIPAVDSTATPFRASMDVVLTGSTKAAFGRVLSNNNNRTLPVLKATLNAMPTFAGHTFGAGSEILDTTSTTAYRIQVQGSVWTTHGFAVAPPASGLHQVGSTRTNTIPNAGGNFGWVCTAAGTPGTWKTFGAIAA